MAQLPGSCLTSHIEPVLIFEQVAAIDRPGFDRPSVGQAATNQREPADQSTCPPKPGISSMIARAKRRFRPGIDAIAVTTPITKLYCGGVARFDQQRIRRWRRSCKPKRPRVGSRLGLFHQRRGRRRHSQAGCGSSPQPVAVSQRRKQQQRCKPSRPSLSVANHTCEEATCLSPKAASGSPLLTAGVRKKVRACCLHVVSSSGGSFRHGPCAVTDVQKSAGWQ